METWNELTFYIYLYIRAMDEKIHGVVKRVVQYDDIKNNNKVL